MKFNKTVFDNGIRLITVPMVDNPSVTVLVMVEAGSKYESKKENGISHFLEHMVFKGTPKRPKAIDISKELDGIGANYNAFTGQEYTGYYAKADVRHFDKILDVVSDMFNNPLFDAKEIEKEKGVIVEEIKMYKDWPQMHVRELFYELVYGDQPAGRNIAGTEENVRSFTREDFINYRAKHYVSGSTLVIVSGNIDEKDVIDKVKKVFNHEDKTKAKKDPIKEEQLLPNLLVGEKETDQTHVVLGVRTFGVNDSRMPTIQVLAGILGKGMSSRLFTKMRDELGICYYVKTENDIFTDHGMLTICAGIDNKRIEAGVEGILSECERLKMEKVSDEELNKVKDYIAGTTMLELETSDSRAEFFAYEEIMKKSIETPEQQIEKIRNVKADDIMRLANQIFVNKGLNMAMVGKCDDKETLKKVLVFNN